jgi:tetraacyldisaccharide 4'-kinase
MPLPPPPPPSRSPWQRLYGAAHRARRRYWRSRAARLPRPVVSVGNLHWGGAGKTPVTAAVARHLRDRGLRVAILSRGYGRSERSGVRVVSTGEGPLLGPAAAGDEPVLLAAELPGVAVLVAAERGAAGRHALARLEPPPDLFVLDDGFSHLRLARDVDLLVFPAADPWAGGRLAPGGRLREPLAAAARADAVLATGEAAPGDGRELARALAPYGFRGPGFAAPARFGPPRRVTGEPLAPGTAVLLVSGVARPGSFARAVAALDLRVTGELRFADHHGYPEESLARIRRAFAEQGAQVVLTTAKDRVKLLGHLDLPLAELPLAAEPEPAFWRWLDDRLGLE